MTCNQKVDENSHFCPDCWMKIEFISDPYCLQCSTPLPADYLGQQCHGCAEHAPQFDRSRSIFRYDELTKVMIHDFKFNDKTIYAKGLGELAFKFANSLIAESDIIIPVPIHPTRLRKRKYNHAALLAKKIAKLAKIKVDVDAIIKNSQTHSQVGLSRVERVKNLRDSFEISNSANVKGKNILLIDDVMTTGATANECARILKKCGAKRVFVVTAARTYS
jgi:ComF family protein